jgi:hypothetical protein
LNLFSLLFPKKRDVYKDVKPRCSTCASRRENAPAPTALAGRRPSSSTRPASSARSSIEKTLSEKRPLLVTGPHDAGKTRWLERLHKEAPLIWGTKSKSSPLWLAAARPLSAWTDVPQLAEWWEKGPHAEGENPVPWNKLKAWERVDTLPLYCEETGAVLFIDDAHKLEGHKLDTAQRCLLASRLWVASAADEGRIPPSLRAVMLHREPQVFRLGSDVAYDVTPLAMRILIAVAISMGAWELAAVLGGLKLLGSGRRAARQT